LSSREYESMDLRSVRWRVIAEAKQRSQRSVIGWLTKICYLVVLRASEGTLSRWSRLDWTGHKENEEGYYKKVSMIITYQPFVQLRF
jgi:hypothetical protein